MGLPAGTKLGRYEVIKHLARGGMADLSVARATGIENFERHVVIKHLRPEQAQDAMFVQMFVTEARLAGSLHHHNIVQVHDIGQSEGRHFFAMEYVHGEDLRRVLGKLSESTAVMPLQHVVTIALAVCAALHHAHEQKGHGRSPLGIVHRDVTPGNILVSYDGNVKVVDFGIAKAVQRSQDTGTGMLKGKVPYMAPEQCTGKPVDRRSDVFAFGIVLYELVTVRRLFKGGNEYHTMKAVVQGEIPPPSKHRADLPPELEQIILRALRRDPAARFQTADEMRLALDQFADKAALRTSTTALADYMKKLFGERPEPWNIDISRTIETPVDFDKTDIGLVPTPTSEPTPTRGSLLEHARKQEVPKLRKVVIPSITGKTTPPPVLLKRAANADSEPVQIVVPEPEPDSEITDVGEVVLEEVPEAPPERVSFVAAGRERTEIVTPLPIHIGDVTHMVREPARDRRWIYLAGAAVAALGVALVIMMTGSDVAKPDKAPVEPKVVAPEPTKVEPVPEPTKIEPVPEPTKIEPVAEPTKVEPVSEPTKVEPVAEPTKVEPVAEPTKVEPVTPKPIATRRPPVVRKPVAKPAPKNPQWDPDALFLKPKK